MMDEVKTTPPVTETFGEAVEKPHTAEKVVVKEGYYRYTDIAFEWAKELNDVQAAAVRAMVNRECLILPDHPLHQGEEEGVTLYMGHLADGKKRLLFSLKQVEYLAYYIHELRLADPSYIAYLETVKVPDGNEDLEVPKLVREKNKRVPMPDGITLPEEYERIEEVILATGAEIKKCVADVSRHNKKVGKPPLVKMIPIATTEPIIDNRPFAQPPPEFEGPEDPPVFSTEAGWGDEDRADLSAPGLPYDAAPNELDEQDRTVASKILELNEYAAELGVPQIQLPPEVNPNSPEQYFYHAQQAFLLASAGGLANAQKSNPTPMAPGDEAEMPMTMPRDEIGRSLFVALKLTTWEEDSMTVLEAGWAGVWFQPKLPAGTKAGEAEKEAAAEEIEEVQDGAKTPSDYSEEEEGYEMMTDQGHYIVQEHMLDKSNGAAKEDYQHGRSLPLAVRELPKAITQKLKDVSARAGGGPIYILIHSADGDQTEFRKIGWKVSGWEKAIHPKGWEFPSYSSDDGVGKVFLIDVAIMFGAIEENGGVAPSLGKTRKTLAQVGESMFGEEKGGAKGGLGNAGNAGNAAYLCLQVFLNLAQCQSLSTLKEEYRKVNGISIPESTTTVSGKLPAQTTEEHTGGNSTDDHIDHTGNKDTHTLQAVVSTSARFSPAPSNLEAPILRAKAGNAQKNDAEDSDDDMQDIKAVFYINAEGDLVPIDE